MSEISHDLWRRIAWAVTPERSSCYSDLWENSDPIDEISDVKLRVNTSKNLDLIILCATRIRFHATAMTDDELIEIVRSLYFSSVGDYT